MLWPHAYGAPATARVRGFAACPAPRRPQTCGNGWTPRASRTTPISPCPVRPRSKCARGNVAEARSAQPAVARRRSGLAVADAAGSLSHLRRSSSRTNDQIDHQYRRRRSLSRSALSRRCSATHRLNLYLDGKLVTGFPRNTASYALTEVPRGTHSADCRGRGCVRQARSRSRRRSTFTVRQESIAQPPVGPSLDSRPSRCRSRSRSTAEQGAHRRSRPTTP